MANKTMAKAAEDSISLKNRYEVTAKGLVQRLHALKLHYLSRCWIKKGPSPASRSPRSPPTSLSASASVFTPGWSDRSSSSDTESEISEQSVSVAAIEENPEIKPSVPRMAFVGKTVVGRLNIHVPKDGSTKYYINWCNRTHDNLLMAPEVMKRVFGTFDALKVGMYFKVTISEVPDHPKEHPKGDYATRVPCPKGKRNRRRSTRSRRRPRRLRTEKRKPAKR